MGVMYINTLLILLCSTAVFARPQAAERPHRPLDKNTKDQSKIVNHIKELINNVVAQEQQEVKKGGLGNTKKPLEFYDTVIKASQTTTTTTTTTTTQELGLIPRIINGIQTAMNSLSFGSPLFGSIAIGRKKRSEFSSDLQILRERIIRTGRDRDETDMIRKAVDAALDQLVLRQEKEELTDMKQIKEEIFLEIAKRLEEEKIKRQNTVEIKDLRPSESVLRP